MEQDRRTEAERALDTVTKANQGTKNSVAGQADRIAVLEAQMAALQAAQLNKPCFRAHKASTNQSVSSATPTLVTFGAKTFDVGVFYSTSTFLWTPPAGHIRIGAQIYMLNGGVVGDNAIAYIRKNGTAIAYQASRVAVNNDQYCMLDINDICSGADAYDVYFQANGAGGKNIGGDPAQTYFYGDWLNG